MNNVLTAIRTAITAEAAATTQGRALETLGQYAQLNGLGQTIGLIKGVAPVFGASPSQVARVTDDLSNVVGYMAEHANLVSHARRVQLLG